MTDELRAAAEQVAKGQPTCGRQCRAFGDASAAVASAYLADHPADDAEPVTDEWVGTRPGWGESGTISLYWRNSRVPCLIWSQRRGLEIIAGDESITLANNATRGEFRAAESLLEIKKAAKS